MEETDFLRELCEIVKQNKDSFDTVIAERASYPYLYHLSRMRENLIDWLPLAPGMRVLELNPECGALTGKLLQRSGNVTCVAKDARHAKVLRARYAGGDGGKPEIVLREQWKDAGPADWDVILLAGDFGSYREHLAGLRKRLAPGGMLVVADANRFGLKYWAGCAEEYGGKFFAGLEGSAEGFGRSGYEKALREAGFTELRFYYPYPDHKFPHTVYSDEWLPQRGELADNLRNFDRDRLVVFDEQKVYNSLLEEGMFSRMANSFLIAAGETRSGGERLCYEKYSNERADSFRIRTEIAADGGGVRRVAKYALEPAGETHIRKLERAYRELAAAYAEGPIEICPCHLEEPAGTVRAVFPFVSGRSLQELLQELAERGCRAEADGLLREYGRRMRRYGGEVPFAGTPEFEKVFGERLPETGLPCARVSNIDFIFSNIFAEETPGEISESVWTAIDYEWTFAFPVPKEFLVYRGLYFAYYQVLIHYGRSLEEILAAADISAESAECYRSMEEHFQEYLSGGVLPVRNMQRLMGTKLIPVEGAVAKAGSVTASGRTKLPVRKILYHIDRQERQDGGIVCSGWALARTWDGRAYPVDIRVTDASGKRIPAGITRNERRDVAESLRLYREELPEWGFDCTWILPGRGKRAEDWNIIFSLGKKEEIYTCTIREKESRM